MGFRDSRKGVFFGPVEPGHPEQANFTPTQRFATLSMSVTDLDIEKAFDKLEIRETNIENSPVD